MGVLLYVMSCARAAPCYSSEFLLYITLKVYGESISIKKKKKKNPPQKKPTTHTHFKHQDLWRNRSLPPSLWADSP